MMNHLAPDKAITYICNVCGYANQRPRSALGREVASCDGCQSTVRMRAMVHLVMRHLHARNVTLPDAPPTDHAGIGLSDWEGYARPLASKARYTNTYFTREPHLDITCPPQGQRSSLDFLIASDVFEHVVPPVELAFKGAADLLKPGGLMAFAVPHGLEGKTEEHFPELHDFHIEENGTGRRLVNRTADGRIQHYDNVCFHGGEGDTLEMRLFSLPSLTALCRAVGLEDPVLMEEVPAFGIVWLDPWSRAMAIRKPSLPHAERPA